MPSHLSSLIPRPQNIAPEGAKITEHKLAHLDFVDALRGWAILGVLIVHTSLRVPGLSSTALDSCRDGRFGVQLFFIISAFTLFLSCQQRWKMDQNPIGAFFIRRATRIIPMYWFALAFYSSLSFLNPGWILPSLTSSQILGNLLFLHGWWPTWINSAVPGGWTIGVEMSFYLLLPFLFQRINTLGKSIALFVASIAFLYALSIPINSLIHYVYGFDAGESVERFTYCWLPSQFAVFSLGIVLFFLWRQTTGRFPAWAGWICIVASVAILAFLIPSQHFTQPLGTIWQHLAFGVAFLLLALGASRGNSLLVNRFTRYIGLVSYSAYLTHPFILAIISTWMYELRESGTLVLPAAAHFAILFTATAATTLVVSHITYKRVELAGINMGKKWIDRFGWGKAKNQRQTADPANLNPQAVVA